MSQPAPQLEPVRPKESRPEGRFLCPRCHSIRTRRSHRQGALDLMLASFGAKMRRCHDCNRRFAAFSRFCIPLGARGGGLSKALALALAFGAGWLLVLWVVHRLGMQG